MIRKQPQRNSLAIAVFAAMVSMSALPAMAQDAGQAGKEEAKTLDTIVVTAQKREQSLQDVPIVVTRLSQEALQDAGVRDIKDLQILTPGLTVTSTQSEAITTARIRGVGTVGDNPGLESSVGIVIDGVYRPRNCVGFGDLGELERIEVLKGPQGTLFGKNTSAGVINIITKRPDFVRSGEIELTAGTRRCTGLRRQLQHAGRREQCIPPLRDQAQARWVHGRAHRRGHLARGLRPGFPFGARAVAVHPQRRLGHQRHR